MQKTFSMFFKLIAGFITLIVVTLTLAVIFGVTVDLSFLKPGVEKAAKSALGREVKIQGPVVFEFSNWTAIDVRDVYIKNVPNATEPDFFTAGTARLEVGLTPLLRGEIHISEIIAEDVTLNLQNDAKGEANWIFGEPKSVVEETAEKDTEKKMIHFGGVDKLSFKKINFNYHDLAIQKTLHAKLDSMTGEIAKGEPIIIDMKGNVNKTLFNMNIEGLPYNQFMDRTKPWAFKLNGEVGGKKIITKGEFLHHDVPEINLAFGIEDIDVGVILSSLGLVKDMSASVGNTAFKVALKGKSLKQVLAESSMFFVVKDGQWKISLPKSKSSFDITKLNGKISVEEGNDLTMDLTGNLKGEPLKLKITGSPLVDYIDIQDEIPLTIDAEIAKMKLQFYSTLALPITSKDLKLGLKLTGERLDSMNELFGLDLPPIGPLHLDTHMQLTEKGYDLSKLDIKVGESTLNGTMNIVMIQKKPIVDIALISDTVQINDFVSNDKSTKKKEQKKVESPKEEKKPKLTQQQKEKIRNLLSEEVLGLMTATIKIEAKEVLSGKDRLGAALAMVSLKNSRFAIEPLRVKLPGGALNVAFSFLPRNNKATVDLKAKIDKFDIGVIARRAKPGTDMGGYLYLDAALHSETPDLKHMMKHAKGHFDFGIVPKNFSAGIIDLWAVNVVSAIMDKETEKDQSQVNCFIMRFGMDDGLMRDKIVYMDTSKMLVSGEAKVNFQEETIEIRMAPKAKKPEFFSLATPIQINGTFKDFGLDINLGSLVGTVISFVTSPVHVPIRRIAVDELPSDGKDACRKAWKYTEEKKKEKNPGSMHEQRLKMLEGR